jgi:hypothetical protein
MEFKGDRDRLSLTALQQIRGPRLNPFWPVFQDVKFPLVRASDLQADIVFGIGPIEAHESGKLIRC